MGYVAVIDYGAGNLMSVVNTLRFLGIEARVCNKAEELQLADRLILPGVGAFPAAMESLQKSGLVQCICEETQKKPLLGICLGMQMLFEESEEIRPCAGLGLIPGRVRRIETDLKLPHIGWNSLDFKNPCPLLKGIDSGAYVYFVHSFCAETAKSENLIATANYGEDVAGIVAAGNVIGCQFHPEKSGEIGLKMLRNFCEM